MDTEQMVAEMHRRPDAHLLVEWIDKQAWQGAGAALPSVVRLVTAAYFRGLEDTEGNEDQ